MPAAIPLAILAVSAIGAGVTYYGQRQAAKATEATAEYNAKLAKMQAVHEGDVAQENALRKQRENSRIIAAQRTALAGSGFDLTGSPLAVLGETQTELQRDILDMGFEAENRRRALQHSATLSLFEGKSSASAQRIAANGQLVSSVASAATSAATSAGYLS